MRILKVPEDSYNAISTLENLGLNPYTAFHIVSRTALDGDDWYVNAYAFATREEAHKALDAYFSVIEKKKVDEIAEKELNSRAFEIHSEDVLK